jgi:hypothetical protein
VVSFTKIKEPNMDIKRTGFGVALLGAVLLAACGGSSSSSPPPAASDNADLSALSISAAALTQIFQADLTSYDATVEFSEVSTTVTPTTADGGASVTVNDAAVASGSASGSIALAEGSNIITVVVTAEDGTTTKTYTIDVLRESVATFVQHAYIASSNAEADDRFGYSVAIQGDTMAVGAKGEDSASAGIDGDQTDNSAIDSGAVYVFVRNNGVWTQQAYLKASNPGSGDQFGHEVDLDGDTLVVSALYEDSDATGINGDQANDNAQDSGAVYVFTRSNNTWSQQAYIKASNAESNDGFGTSATLDNDTLVVGAYQEDSSATGVNGDQTSNASSVSGAAYVFVRNGGVWEQQAYLKASNTGADDRFGASVAVENDTLFVGAVWESSNATGIAGDQVNNDASRSGAVYLFTRAGTTWTQQAYIKASNTEADDWFGAEVDLSGDTLVVGALFEDSEANGVGGDQTNNNASSAGAVFVFVGSGANWTQQAYIKASNSDAGDEFGEEIAIQGDTLVIAANSEDSVATGVDGDQLDNTVIDSGAVYVFERAGGVWSQISYLKASNTDAGDGFGYNLALSDGTVIVTARDEDSAAQGIDGDQSDNSAPSSGAVYEFH